jgi:peptidoglycan/LPS O-acetylase OafA/YrhL
LALVVRRLTTPRLVAIVIGAAGLTISTAARKGGLDVGWAWPHLADGFARVLFPFAVGVLLRRLPVWRNHLALILPLVLAAVLLAPSLGAMGQAAVVILAVPAIVYLGAGAAPSRADGVARWLGLMSYPIYVIHHPLLRVIQRGAEMVHIRSPGVLIAAGFIGPLIAAYLLNRFYDVPVRAWLATWAPGRRAAAPRPAM